MYGPANDKNTPTDLPNNEWTQMIEAVHARNQRGTSLTPDEIAGGVPVVGTPMPSVRSADLGKPIETDANRPYTEAEVEELNRAALASGLLRGPVNPSIARTIGASDDGMDSNYATLEEAIAAGAPVTADEHAIAEGAARFREPTPVTPALRVGPPRVPQARIPQLQATVTMPSMPRLPDFKKVQMVDMVNGRVWVDDLSFDCTPAEIQQLRKFCITKARTAIQKALDEAMRAVEEADGGTETV